MIQSQTLPAQERTAAKVPDAVEIAGSFFQISKSFLKTASLKNEWRDDVNNPEETIRALKAQPVEIDILKFWQRIPDTEAKFHYYKEWRQVAAIPISTYDVWWKSLKDKTRNMVRKAAKKGVIISEVPFTDELARGMREIFNQSPIRRGKPMRHYGKSFETVKAEMGAHMEESIIVAAHYQNELIGFIKFMVMDRYGTLTMILDKTAHRDKAPINGMLAKVVEICAERKLRHLTYTTWRRGEHGHFQQNNGFEKFPIPEYYVPLTLKGRIAVGLRLHEGIKGWLPGRVHGWLVDLRTKWYTFRFQQKKT
jgi:hypothetical protein